MKYVPCDRKFASTVSKEGMTRCEKLKWEPLCFLPLVGERCGVHPSVVVLQKQARCVIPEAFPCRHSERQGNMSSPCIPLRAVHIRKYWRYTRESVRSLRASSLSMGSCFLLSDGKHNVIFAVMSKFLESQSMDMLYKSINPLTE